MLTALALVIAVYDGDTLTLQDGTRIRLYAADACELRGPQRWPDCTRAEARAAKAALQRLVLHRQVEIEPVGRSYSRQVARVRVDGVNVACALVAGGHARWWAKYGGEREAMTCR